MPRRTLRQIEQREWIDLVLSGLTIAPMPDFLLIPLVASLARDQLGLHFRGRKPPPQVVARIQTALAHAMEVGLIEESGNDLRIGPNADAKYQPAAEALVVSDTGWRHASSSRPMQGWTELERIVEFAPESPGRNIDAALRRLRDGWETLLGGGQDVRNEEEQLAPVRWLLRVWQDHTSIY